MNFIELLNGVIHLAKPVSAEQSFAKSMDDRLIDLQLDSLDTIMLSMYLGEIYGISEDTMREMKVETVAELMAFLDEHKTRSLTDVEVELAKVK